MLSFRQAVALFVLWTSACSASPLMMGMGGMGGGGDSGGGMLQNMGLGGGSGATSSGAGGSGGCPALQLVFARGTTEAQGTLGIVGKPLCTGLQAQIPNTACYDVEYSSNAEYMMTVAAGGTTADNYVKSLKSRCPDTKVVLGGYSKGAMICHRVQANSGNVVGAVTFGDPLKMQPMPSTSAWKMFCALGDPVCENGFNMMAHLTYGQNIGTAVSFLVNAYKAGGGGVAGGDATAGAPTSAGSGASTGGLGMLGGGSAAGTPSSAGSGASSGGLGMLGGGASDLFSGGGLAKMMGGRSIAEEPLNASPVAYDGESDDSTAQQSQDTTAPIPYNDHLVDSTDDQPQDTAPLPAVDQMEGDSVDQPQDTEQAPPTDEYIDNSAVKYRSLKTRSPLMMNGLNDLDMKGAMPMVDWTKFFPQLPNGAPGGTGAMPDLMGGGMGGMPNLMGGMGGMPNLMGGGMMKRQSFSPSRRRDQYENVKKLVMRGHTQQLRSRKHRKQSNGEH